MGYRSEPPLQLVGLCPVLAEHDAAGARPCATGYDQHKKIRIQKSIGTLTFWSDLISFEYPMIEGLAISLSPIVAQSRLQRFNVHAEINLNLILILTVYGRFVQHLVYMS